MHDEDLFHFSSNRKSADSDSWTSAPKAWARSKIFYYINVHKCYVEPTPHNHHLLKKRRRKIRKFCVHVQVQLLLLYYLLDSLHPGQERSVQAQWWVNTGICQRPLQCEPIGYLILTFLSVKTWDFREGAIIQISRQKCAHYDRKK